MLFELFFLNNDVYVVHNSNNDMYDIFAGEKKLNQNRMPNLAHYH